MVWQEVSPAEREKEQSVTAPDRNVTPPCAPAGRPFSVNVAVEGRTIVDSLTAMVNLVSARLTVSEREFAEVAPE